MVIMSNGIKAPVGGLDLTVLGLNSGTSMVRELDERLET